VRPGRGLFLFERGEAHTYEKESFIIDTISLLQWNILYSEPIDHIAEFLLQHKPDIICLQELTIGAPGQTVHDTPAYLAKALGYHYHTKELPIVGTDGTRMLLANGIFSRFPLTNQTSAWINEPSDDAGGFNNEYRAYIEATLELSDGKTLTIGTTHMSYTHRFEPTPAKRAETNKLLELITPHKANYIFTGDLNALPDSYTIQKLGRKLQHLGPDVAEKSWTTKPFSYRGFEANTLDWRLDYAFATPDIEVISSQILSTDYSDHLPVRVAVKVPA